MVSCIMIHIPRWAKRGGISHGCMESYKTLKSNFSQHFYGCFSKFGKTVYFCLAELARANWIWLVILPLAKMVIGFCCLEWPQVTVRRSVSSVKIGNFADTFTERRAANSLRRRTTISYDVRRTTYVNVEKRRIIQISVSSTVGIVSDGRDDRDDGRSEVAPRRSFGGRATTVVRRSRHEGRPEVTPRSCTRPTPPLSAWRTPCRWATRCISWSCWCWAWNATANGWSPAQAKQQSLGMHE